MRSIVDYDFILIAMCRGIRVVNAKKKFNFEMFTFNFFCGTLIFVPAILPRLSAHTQLCSYHILIVPRLINN